MPIDDLNRDGPLTPEEEALIELLSDSDLAEIDEMLISNTNSRWRKVAFVVANSMGELREPIPGIPDVFYAQRVQKLVERGRLEVQGNLDRMRYSEVRQPVTDNGSGET